MKIFLYNILTLLIMCLGKIRSKIKINMRYGHKGIMEVPYARQSFTDTCCDCGLTHANRIISFKKIKWKAVRPQGYRYKFRLKAVNNENIRITSDI